MNHINDIKSEEHGAPEIWGVFVSLEVKLFPEQMSRTTNWCQSFFCSFFKTHQKNTNHDDTSSFFLTRRWTYGSFSSSCDDRNVFLSHGEFLWIIPPGILRPDWLRTDITHTHSSGSMMSYLLFIKSWRYKVSQSNKRRTFGVFWSDSNVRFWHILLNHLRSPEEDPKIIFYCVLCRKPAEISVHMRNICAHWTLSDGEPVWWFHSELAEFSVRFSYDTISAFMYVCCPT